MNSQAEWTYLFDRKLRIWSLLLKKTLMENFIFCAVISLFLWSLQRNYPYSSQARRNRGGWGAAAKFYFWWIEKNSVKIKNSSKSQN